MFRQLFGWTTLLGILLMASHSTGAAPAVALEDTPARQPTVQLPQNIDGHLIRQFKQGEHTINVDLGRQTLHLELPKEIDWRQKGEFRVGDLIRLKRNSALRKLTSVLAPVRAGQQLTVQRVHEDGKWIEASVIASGNLIRGWLLVDDIEFITSEFPLKPTLKQVSQDEFASAGTLAHKAKQFDDGLMATIQLAAQTGHGKFAGKAAMLERLALQLAVEESGQLFLAACSLGKIPAQIPATNKRAVDSLLADFLSDPVRSKPIGFYTWNQNLSSLFQQDRMLQSDLTQIPGTNALVITRLLQRDKSSRKAYQAYLTLQSQLTNPQVNPDLRPLLAALDAGQTPEIPAGTRFFPPSYSHETDLLKRMFPNGLIPPDFQLMDELVAQVKSGALELTPRPDSGWYDHQIWSLEPYVRPHQMPEGSRWSGNDEYHGHLTKLFKGVWALTRETHIKDLEILAPAAAPFDQPEPEPKIQIRIEPQLSAEPVATSYLRRALSYRFVRKALTEQFGDQSLRQLHRQTATGPVAQNLDDELRQMEALYHGAFVTVTRQLGIIEQNAENAGSGAGADADAQTFRTWAANPHRDPDLGTDIRMMVPVYYDLVQKKTKVWAFLGWTTQRVYVSFEQPPEISVRDKTGKPVDQQRLEISYSTNSYTIATPMFQELFVSKLLNRDEFRKHCDAYGSATAILKNLE
ncbi:MAG: hypothetical protein JWM11_2572 [Planctomycetaceae bacterium]|nr:hypothetical protein [Planctomycetaceae bacterium]